MKRLYTLICLFFCSTISLTASDNPHHQKPVHLPPLLMVAAVQQNQLFSREPLSASAASQGSTENSPFGTGRAAHPQAASTGAASPTVTAASSPLINTNRSANTTNPPATITSAPAAPPAHQSQPAASSTTSSAPKGLFSRNNSMEMAATPAHAAIPFYTPLTDAERQEDTRHTKLKETNPLAAAIVSAASPASAAQAAAQPRQHTHSRSMSGVAPLAIDDLGTLAHKPQSAPTSTQMRAASPSQGSSSSSSSSCCSCSCLASNRVSYKVPPARVNNFLPQSSSAHKAATKK